MSKKLEKVLECLLNEEHASAEELLHDFVVEKARQCYQDLVNEEDMDMEEGELQIIHKDSEEEEDEMSEDIGGDMADDFASEIEASDDMEGDEEMDDMESMEDMEGEAEVEDRVEDLESALADLRAQFDALTAGEESEEMDDMGDMEEMEDEEEAMEAYESLEEATDLQDKVSAPANTDGAENTKSMYSQSPKKTAANGKPVNFVSSEEQSKKEGEGKDHTPTSNVSVNQGSVAKPEKSEKADGTDTLLTKTVK